MKKLILICLVLFLGTAAFATLEISRAQGGVEVTTDSILKLRAGPGTRYEDLGRIPAGTTLIAFARDEQTGWVKVEFEGKAGWVNVAFISFKGNLRALPIGDAAPPAGQAPTGGIGGATPTPPNSTGAPQNGQIESMTLYAQTDRVDYYNIVYYSDGLRIAGFYAEPRSPGKYPAVIYNRGGNRGTGALQGYEFAPFAEMGFVVAASQYRGGPGSEGADQLGGGDVNDVLALIPLLKSRGQVDPSRIAMFGSSRGALMTYIALRKLGERGSSDIKVAATTSALTDLFMWAKERPDLNGGAYLELVGATTSGNPAAFRARSATYWAGLIRVPLLIQHGDADTVVSVEQSKALGAALKRTGRSYKLIIQAFGDHGLFTHDEGYPETMKWFQQYIGRSGDNWDYYYWKDAILNAIGKLRKNW
ncbi:MAG: prolyl oligopeptidase family serine peptidase [Anaerolineae bacterium]|nr:prolyl oligopeptidase family serine peptidase [Anaerolineae bacterium]